MTLREALVSVGVGMAAGALIGAERQQATTERGEADKFGGIRTFPLIALLGAVGALLRPHAGVWVLALLLAAIGALLAIAYAHATAEEDHGLSTEVAALITFGLGAVAATPEVLPDPDRYLLVAALAAVTMAVLAIKKPLHSFVAKVKADDVYATVKFVLLALVVLPVLPNQTFGPLDVLNPFKIGLMIVLVAGMSFAGYVAVRVVGAGRGLLVTGVLGGLVSSTAVTLTYAGRAKAEPAIARYCAIAIVSASSIMFARVIAVIAAVDRPLLPSVALPLGAMAVVGLAAAAIQMRMTAGGEGRKARDVPLKNPFELGQAVKFGLLYGAVLFAAKAAQTYVGASGVYASALLAGLTDVDAITLSMADLHRSGMSARTAAIGVVLATTTNTLVKVGMALVIGGAALGRAVALSLGAALVAGGASAWIASVL